MNLKCFTTINHVNGINCFVGIQCCMCLSIPVLFTVSLLSFSGSKYELGKSSTSSSVPLYNLLCDKIIISVIIGVNGTVAHLLSIS